MPAVSAGAGRGAVGGAASSQASSAVSASRSRATSTGRAGVTTLHHQVAGEQSVRLGLVGLAAGHHFELAAVEGPLGPQGEGEHAEPLEAVIAVAGDAQRPAAGAVAGWHPHAHVEGGLAVAQPAPPGDQAEQQQRVRAGRQRHGVQRPLPDRHATGLSATAEGSSSAGLVGRGDPCFGPSHLTGGVLVVVGLALRPLEVLLGLRPRRCRRPAAPARPGSTPGCRPPRGSPRRPQRPWCHRRRHG